MSNRCRLCGSLANTKILHKLNFSKSNTKEIIGNYDVCICNACGFGYADGVFNQKDLNQYYMDNSKYEGFLDSDDLDDVYEDWFLLVTNLVEKYISDYNTHIMDIGCATGGMLKRLQKIGYTNLTGVDPSPVCVDHINKISGAKGICATIDHLDKENSADVILTFFVLEHIADIHKTMRQLSDMTNKKGYLFVSVPDVCGFNTSNDSPFQEFSIEHINYFSQHSLKFLASMYGFDLVEYAKFHRGWMICVFRKFHDSLTEASLISYIENSKKLEDSIIKKIKPYWDKQIIVWGLGTFCRYLLAENILSKCEITTFVDQNPHYSGVSMTVNDRDIPVILPPDLNDTSTPIMIISKFYQKDILLSIKEKYMLKNPVILLFDEY